MILRAFLRDWLQSSWNVPRCCTSVAWILPHSRCKEVTPPFFQCKGKHPQDFVTSDFPCRTTAVSVRTASMRPKSWMVGRALDSSPLMSKNWKNRLPEDSMSWHAKLCPWPFPPAVERVAESVKGLYSECPFHYSVAVPVCFRTLACYDKSFQAFLWFQFLFSCRFGFFSFYCFPRKKNIFRHGHDSLLLLD